MDEPLPATCPRCGYDQSGIVATWTEACPLEGVCSECGLEMEWKDVLGPDAGALRWFVEHVPRIQVLPASIATMFRVLLPWVFWRQVQLQGRMRLRRAVLGMALVLGGLHVMASVAIGVGDFRVVTTPSPHLVTFGFQAPETDLVSHVLWAVMYPVFWFEVSNTSDFLAGGTAATISVAIWDAWNGVVLVGLLATLAIPLFMMLVSGTLKRAKVKRRHVLRATIYSFAWLIVPAAMRLTHGMLYAATGDDYFDKGGAIGAVVQAVREAQWIPIGIIMGWLLAWWHLAIRRGWQVRQPLWHTVLLLLLASLAAGMVALFAGVGLMRDVLGLGII